LQEVETWCKETRRGKSLVEEISKYGAGILNMYSTTMYTNKHMKRMEIIAVITSTTATLTVTMISTMLEKLSSHCRLS
jgi:hypothetical protein